MPPPTWLKRRGAGPAPSAPDRSRGALARTADRILTESVIPFWTGLVDGERGGYLLNHDAAGNYRGPSDRFLVTQARMLWFHARLAREGRVPRDGADAGYRFLRDHMWDQAHGGFHWAVDHSGDTATGPEKHLYGQAFGLYALSEYARISPDPEPDRLCRELFELIDRHAHDAAGGGYRESFLADWSSPPPDRPGCLGRLPDRKLLNTHLHLLEALTSLSSLTAGDGERTRLAELVTICSQTVVDPRTGGCRDEHLSDWTPLTGGDGDRVQYGHDLENVALLLSAGTELGLKRRVVLRRCRPILAHTLAHGADPEQGGFFAGGVLGREADRREKLWWTQAEALLCFVRVWRATRRRSHLDRLASTLEWVDRRQVDRAGGDWHASIAPDGTASGDKAGAWKDPYHQTRALLEVAALA